MKTIQRARRDKAAERGEYGGSACEESVISQAKCEWLTCLLGR